MRYLLVRKKQMDNIGTIMIKEILFENTDEIGDFE